MIAANFLFKKYLMKGDVPAPYSFAYKLTFAFE